MITPAEAEEGDVRLDPQHPWPGLGSYDERGSNYFSGRKNEALDLSQMIRLYGAVVLSGESGLGKTSLLRAGVFPQLRKLEFFPVYLRLDHSATAPDYEEQVIAMILEECRTNDGIEEPDAPGEGESLWNWLHREDLEFWSSENQLLMPVLVFDQFEEAFTRATESKRQTEVEEFFGNLADLAENRLPDVMPDGCSESQDYRIVLSLRKEYLSELETSLSAQMPSVMKNRFHLAPLSKKAARDVVIHPSAQGDLLEPGAADAIIRAVTGLRIDRSGGGTRASGTDEGEENTGAKIEPALLCLLCSELNLKRAADEKISVELVKSQRDDIIEGFYSRAVEDLGEEVERMVETLVTPNGYRQSRTLDEVDAEEGVERDDIDALVKRRLLRLDRGLGGRRTVELMHDCLAPIVVRRREERQRVDLGREKRIKRLKWLAAGMTMLALIALVVGLVLVNKQTDLAESRLGELADEREKYSVSDDITAQGMLERGDPTGTAYLARAVRVDPELEIALEHAVTALTEMPARRFLFSEPGLLFGPWIDQKQIVTVSGEGHITVRQRDGTDARKLSLGESGAILAAHTASSAPRVAVAFRAFKGQKVGNGSRSDSEDGTNPSDSEKTSLEKEKLGDADPDGNEKAQGEGSKGSGNEGKNDEPESDPEEAGGERSSPSLVVIKDLDTGKDITRLEVATQITGLVMHPKGSKALLLDIHGQVFIVDSRNTEAEAEAEKTTRNWTPSNEDGEPINVRFEAITTSERGDWIALGTDTSTGDRHIYQPGKNDFERIYIPSTASEIERILEVPVSHWTLIVERSNASQDGTTGSLIRVLDDNGDQQASLQTGTQVQAIGCGPNGIRAIALEKNGTESHWNLLTGERYRDDVVWPSGGQVITDLGATSIAALNDGSVYEQSHRSFSNTPNTSGEFASFVGEINNLRKLKWKNHGSSDVLAVSCDDLRIRFLDPETGESVRPPELCDREPNPIMASRDGRVLAAAVGAKVRIITEDQPTLVLSQSDEESIARVTSLDFLPGAREVAFLTDSAELYLSRTGQGEHSDAEMLLSFDEEEGEHLACSNNAETPLVALVTSTDNEYILRVVNISEAETSRITLNARFDHYIREIGFDQSGRWLSVVGFSDKALVYDLMAPGEAPRRLGHPAEVYSAVFHPHAPVDQPVLITGDSDGQVRKWNVTRESWDTSQFQPPLPGAIVALDLDDEGELVSAATIPGQLGVYSLDDGRSFNLGIKHRSTVWQGCFMKMAEGAMVFSCSKDGRLLRTPLRETRFIPSKEDALMLSWLLEANGQLRFDDEGRIKRLSKSEQADLEAKLDSVSGEEQKRFVAETRPHWDREATIQPEFLSHNKWRALRGQFSSGVWESYDAAPGDPVHLLAIAAWHVDADVSEKLKEQALEQLGDHPDDAILSAALMMDQFRHGTGGINRRDLNAALSLVGKNARHTTWDEQRTLARLWSQSGNDGRARAALPVPPLEDSLDSTMRAELVLEYFRCGDSEMAAMVLESIEEDVLKSPDRFEVAWACLATATHLSETGEDGERVIELAQSASKCFEPHRWTKGWQADAHLGYALNQFLLAKCNGSTDSLLGSRANAVAAYGAYEDVLAGESFRRDPFSQLLGIHDLEDLRKALADVAGSPLFDETSADIILGRVLHQWFERDADGARRTWNLLVEKHPHLNSPSEIKSQGLWPYEVEAVMAIRNGDPLPANFGPVPSDEEEWELAGMAAFREVVAPGSQVPLEDYTDNELAGRVLHAAWTNQPEMAAKAAEELLRRDPAWAEPQFLEAQGWEPEEVARFLSAIVDIDGTEDP